MGMVSPFQGWLLWACEPRAVLCGWHRFALPRAVVSSPVQGEAALVEARGSVWMFQKKSLPPALGPVEGGLVVKIATRAVYVPV